MRTGAEGLSVLVVEDIAIARQAGASSRIENYMDSRPESRAPTWSSAVRSRRSSSVPCFTMPRRVERLLVESDGLFSATLDDGGSGSRPLRSRRDRSSISPVAAGAARAVRERRRLLRRDRDGSAVLPQRRCRRRRRRELCRPGRDVSFAGRAPRPYPGARRQSVGHDVFLPRAAAGRPTQCRDSTSAPRSPHCTATLVLRSITARSGGKEKPLSARALFAMIGASPNTDWLSELVELDSRGFVKTGKALGALRAFETSLPGIFAIGDVRAGSVKRVASAAGEGSVVVPGIYEFLADPQK